MISFFSFPSLLELGNGTDGPWERKQDKTKKRMEYMESKTKMGNMKNKVRDLTMEYEGKIRKEVMGMRNSAQMAPTA